MATKKTAANTEAKKKVERVKPEVRKAATKKATTKKATTKKAEEKKPEPEIIDVEDFREVTEETVEVKVDPAEVINPPEDAPEVEAGFNVSETVKALMNKYKVDVNDQGGIEALENIMSTIVGDLHEKAGMDEKTSQVIAMHATETILAGINDAFKVEKRLKAKADRLAAREERLNKKIQMTREERQNILYGSTNTFGAPGIYSIKSNLPSQIQVQVGGEA